VLVDGIPVTTVARTVFDLASCVHPSRAERALDNALTRKLVDLESMRATTIELLRPGRTGSALMRQLLAVRGAGYIPPASGMEARVLALLAAVGIEMEWQVDRGGDVWIGRVDFYYRRLRLVIEVDSDLHHDSKLDVESDERRDAALRAAGFEVLRIKEQLLRESSQDVVVVVREALARRKHDLKAEPVPF
jgi:very-short-patch-repair endonuclease